MKLNEKQIAFDRRLYIFSLFCHNFWFHKIVMFALVYANVKIYETLQWRQSIHGAENTGKWCVEWREDESKKKSQNLITFISGVFDWAALFFRRFHWNCVRSATWMINSASWTDFDLCDIASGFKWNFTTSACFSNFPLLILFLAVCFLSIYLNMRERSIQRCDDWNFEITSISMKCYKFHGLTLIIFALDSLHRAKPQF